MPSLNDIPELFILQNLIRRKNIEIYLVGGFLRDLHISRSVKDFDFAISSGALALARTFAKKISGAFVLLDEERGCARVAKKKQGELWTFDFADFRDKTFKKDLNKRDFTINTFAVDVRTLKAPDDIKANILSNVKALADIKAKTIRVMSKNAFKDDPLRLLRAYSLMAQLGFKIETETLKGIKAQVALISDVSPERVREELFKVFDSPRAAEVLKAMDKSGLLFEVMPQLKLMKKIEQGGYHHLDVWAHSLETISQLQKLIDELMPDADLKAYLDEKISGGHSRRALLVFGCLLHDSGKPETKKIEEGRTSFHGHEHAGRHVARVIAKELMLSTKERYALEDMVTLHLRPGYLSNFKKPSDRMIFRYFRDAKDEAASIVLLALADQRSTRGPLTTEHDVKHHHKIAFPLIAQYFRKKKEKPFVRLIDGNDLIKKLKLEPGPAFAKILKEVEEAQHLGRVTTRDEALALAVKVAQKVGGAS